MGKTYASEPDVVRAPRPKGGGSSRAKTSPSADKGELAETFPAALPPALPPAGAAGKVAAREKAEDAVVRSRASFIVSRDRMRGCWLVVSVQVIRWVWVKYGRKEEKGCAAA